MSDRDLVELRREFHRFPELGFQEENTTAKVAEILRGMGLEVHEGAGVVGVLRAGQGNRAIGLRADMDAPPIHEMSSHDYASQTPGVMHVCRHDGHMTMLLDGASGRCAGSCSGHPFRRHGGVFVSKLEIRKCETFHVSRWTVGPGCSP